MHRKLLHHFLRKFLDLKVGFGDNLNMVFKKYSNLKFANQRMLLILCDLKISVELDVELLIKPRTPLSFSQITVLD